MHNQIRFLKRKLTSRRDLGFLLAVIWMSAPSTSMCCSTLVMFFVSSMPRWWLPTKGICSSFIIVTIPVACYPLSTKHVILCIYIYIYIYIRINKTKGEMLNTVLHKMWHNLLQIMIDGFSMTIPNMFTK